MYELLLRTETLLSGVETPALLGVGLGALVVGLILWLGGNRYSAALIGLLGAVVGSGVGLLVSRQVNSNPWLSMTLGAVVLGGLSILLRNVLILVLAVLVFSAVSGAGYLSVVLDRAIPSSRSEVQTEANQALQYFSDMDRDMRQKYLGQISHDAQTFAERLNALLANTWEAVRPQGWAMILAVAAGAVLGILLVWLIAKIVIALAYSIVGTAAIFLGVQAALLAAGIPAVSNLDTRRWLLLVAFVTVTVVGWLWQLFYAGAKKPKAAPPKGAEPSD